VPSGNFGNICAGMMAWKSGMPVGRFIAACNANDVVPRYLAGQSYTPTQARPTLSNAMDVGNPSNFVRVMEIFMGKKAKLTDMLHSVAVSDADTLQTIKDVYNKTGYLLDPHGAVGYKALADYLEQHSGQKGMVLETAHPVKFPDVVEQAIGQQPPMPPAIQPLFERKKKSLLMDPGFENLKEWLLSRPN
jgi:threonine synthase